MKVDFDAHARKRQRERGVSDDDVFEVLRSYETDLPAKKGRRNRYKVIAGKRIRVTFDEIADNEFYVWTVTSDEVSIE